MQKSTLTIIELQALLNDIKATTEPTRIIQHLKEIRLLVNAYLKELE